MVGCSRVGCACDGSCRPDGMYRIPSVFTPYENPARGWICPVCGKGNAPTTPQCFCKNNLSDNQEPV